MTCPVLTFLGAAGTVTGSRFLVETAAARVLVDAGLYQGLADLRRRNWAPLAVPSRELAAVVLTHAHLDHCGYLPRLVREGFSGPVFCTRDTAALVENVLPDMTPTFPTNGVSGLAGAVQVDVAEGVRAVLAPAGHILGSATVLLTTAGRRTVFSGDLGRAGHPILRPPDPPPSTHALVVESTYGDRRHARRDPEVLASAVRRTVGRGGCVLIPAFAVDRTELVLLDLHRLMEAGRVPRVPVYLDSPMALSALSVYRHALRSGSVQLRADLGEVRAALDCMEVEVVPDVPGSMRLNRPASPCVVISASGMATGGRVVHHLAHQLPDPRNCVVLTGFQAVGTRGRQLLEGAREVKIHGRHIAVRAEIVDVPHFSVHADADEILSWLASAPSPPEVVYVTHGEQSASAALAGRIHDELGWCAVVPRDGERVRLD